MDNKKTQSQTAQIPPELSKEIDEIMRRLRLLEERYSGLRKKTQVTEQNMIKDAREIFKELKVLNDTITEVKGEFSEMNDKLLKLNDEIQNAVKKTEFNVLSKYIDFWQPLNYITRDEVEKLIREKK